MGYVNVLLCQFEVSQKKDHLREWVELSDIKDQLETVWTLMDETHRDLVIIPETCYFPELDGEYSRRSKDRIIIAGSGYNNDGINETHIYQNGTHRAIRKIFSSPVEVMELNYPNTLKPDSIIHEWEDSISSGVWPEYFVDMPDGKKLAVLTCMDYYRLGYYIAASSVISPRLWGMAAPSSNGRQDIFLRLTGAIHDANERVYSIVVNSHDHSRPPDYDQGGSYVYGPVTGNVRQKLLNLSQTDKHFSAIYRLGGGAKALGLSLMTGEDVTFFARSKNFYSNPTHVKEYDLYYSGTKYL